MSSPTHPHLIVACHAWYDDMIGGSFRLASEFAIDLANRGHRVSYVCCAAPGKECLPAQEVVDGVQVHRYSPPAAGTSGRGRMAHHVQQTRMLVEQLDAKNPIVAVSSHSPLQGLGAAKALHSRKNVLINYTVHSPFDDELLSNVAGNISIATRLSIWMAGRVERRNCALADRVQTLSQFTMDQIAKKYGSVVKGKGIVAPGWVETERFQPAEDRGLLRSQLGGDWRTDHPLFFTLRRLENRMGLDTLVDACALLRQRGHSFRLLIGGGGPLRDELQSRIDAAELRDSVRLLGRLPETQLPLAYAAADCFVLPTRALECFGLIVLEAFACQTPVIATNVAAIPELASQQEMGWMFPPGDSVALADRMECFVTGDLQASKDLREIALNYDRSRVIDRWSELLEIPQTR
ncbi:GDP-mannose-dependent alpha-(1-6)-phosphatidylinositol monomannoside mannosyltransferase [Novipirellula galeiformis]|uniref:GDP-mannose-dependent alpha-(1-6)-phosphatidylinositol monomannoside mannosyltransferase n=1 Tax=Novipirellula galeiformis TaxID=2528004 RepID=A0A5C6CUS1_9BACT|nr:glycosyltransferase family 4 protein [Novipirellula galeiformis]TWU27161.1 GDP-mannose-dependent alpha-(1-6)-phosphatidylinositol monomannoside mannosyltransferase [Novipirellula galeiformis]